MWQVMGFAAFYITAFSPPNLHPRGKADGLLTRCFTYIAQVPHLMLTYTHGIF